MDITLLVTKTDFCLPNLEAELQNMGLGYKVEYVEEHAEIVSAFKIRHSPNVFINGELVFRHQPTPTELKQFLG